MAPKRQAASRASKRLKKSTGGNQKYSKILNFLEENLVPENETPAENNGLYLEIFIPDPTIQAKEVEIESVKRNEKVEKGSKTQKNVKRYLFLGDKTLNSM